MLGRGKAVVRKVLEVPPTHPGQAGVHQQAAPGALLCGHRFPIPHVLDSLLFGQRQEQTTAVSIKVPIRVTPDSYAETLLVLCDGTGRWGPWEVVRIR